LPLFVDLNLCTVNIWKAFIKMVMIFESAFFVVLTAGHLKHNLESELLVIVYNAEVNLSGNEKIFYDLAEYLTMAQIANG